MSGIFDWLWGKPKPEESRPVGPLPPVDADLYGVLHVSPQASSDEIRTAFRDLALKFHPDRNPNDPIAEQRYKEIATAYSILSDETQRAAYDRMRGRSSAPPPPMPTSLIIPPGETQVRREAKQPTREERAPGAITPNIWAKLIGPPEGKAGAQDIVDVFAKRPPPPKIPSAESPFSWAQTTRVPVSPGVDTPTAEEVFHIINHEWPLEGIWDVVRANRSTNAFHQAGAMAVDVVAGGGTDPAEWDLSKMFHIPLRETQEFVRYRGNEAFFQEILFPIFNNVTAIFSQIKPPDIPGEFFLEWDPTGKNIELVYLEKTGRRR